MIEGCHTGFRSVKPGQFGKESDGGNHEELRRSVGSLWHHGFAPGSTSERGHERVGGVGQEPHAAIGEHEVRSAGVR